MQIYLKGKGTMQVEIWMESKETPRAGVVVYKGKCVEDLNELLLPTMHLHLVPRSRMMSYTSTPL
jgi:hypothetical protein